MHVSEPLQGELAERARQAIAAAGGGAKLARLLNIRRSAVQAWKSTRIPVGQVPALARITGLSLSDLRPDVFDPPPSAHLPEEARDASAALPSPVPEAP